MSIGTFIIKSALQGIGKSSIAAPADPESIEVGQKKLNSMLEMWLSKGIQIGFTPLAAPGDELNEPADTTDGIISNLSIRLAPDFDNGESIVSSDLRMLARSSFRDIKAQYQVLTIPKLVPSSTLPRGQGNNDDFFRQPFFGRNAEID